MGVAESAREVVASGRVTPEVSPMLAQCTIPDCGRPFHARGYCRSHYERWRRLGDPGGAAAIRQYRSDPAPIRFWTQVEFTEKCWLWNGSQDGRGYGLFRIDGKSIRAHRWAYEFCVGPIPAGLELDHVRARGCTNTACVSPDHLEPVSHQENTLRGDGPSSTNARKDVAPCGHAYNATHKNGTRYCRPCGLAHMRARVREYRKSHPMTKAQRQRKTELQRLRRIFRDGGTANRLARLAVTYWQGARQG